MRINNGFMLREVGATKVIIAIGAAARDFRAIAHINTTGAIIFTGLKDGKTVEEIARTLTDLFKVDFERAEADAKRFTAKLVEAGIARDGE